MGEDAPSGDPGAAVDRIAHTAASPEGENSTYVLPAHGLVIDPGPPGDGSWAVLTDGLAAAGLPVAAVETVVVTHWHADHAGLAPRLADAADATLVLHEADAPLVGAYAAERERRVARDARRLREWGVPEATVEAVLARDEPSPMPDSYPVTAVADGDAVGGVGQVLHTPGHTAGHLALAVGPTDGPGAAGQSLFVGDAVLPTYTPNVGGTDTRMHDPLADYLDTLERLAAFATGRRETAVRDTGTTGDAGGHRPPDDAADPVGVSARAFPGHGAAVALPERIATIRDHHADRVRNVLAALPASDAALPGTDDAGPPTRTAAAPDSSSDAGRTPWTVACELFGDLEGIHVKMGAGEAAAHLAFAVGRGLAERVGETPDRYVRTVAAGDVDAVDPLPPSRYC